MSHFGLTALPSIGMTEAANLDVRRSMRRVVVIGSSGSGKSTLSLRISERTGLPVFHLDVLYFKPGWVKTPKPEWSEMIAQLASRDSWIIDGNHASTLEVRLATCDSIVFLDFPPWVCVWRVLKRGLRYRGQIRSDVGNDCPHRLTLGMLIWVWAYPRKRKTRHLRMIHAVAHEKQLFVLRSETDVEHFLAGLSAPSR
jgi:adenylate kinase family enzyme